jgi:plastocyanin
MARAQPGRAVGALAAAAVAVLLLTGCRDDGADEGAGPGAEGGGASSTDSDPGAGADLTVEAHDIDFDRDAYRIAAGPVDVTYTQEGVLPHSLVIEVAGGGEVDGFKLEVGDTDADSAMVDLSPGDYVLYCDVAGHREAGMEAELRVE